MNDYLILTFVDGETVVIHDDLRFDTNLKPELSFAFDASISSRRAAIA